MHNVIENITITLADLTIGGLRCPANDGSPEKVLCLHGWLDNANSFYPLMPLLPNLDCVSIDLPGHGKSGHYQQNIPYTIASSAHYALQTAEAMGWEQYHIIGHSLGGCIAPVCAIAEPDKIKSLTLIDAIGPIAESAGALPDRLRRFHQEMKPDSLHRSRVFDDISLAVQSRLKATKMYEQSARLIVERQLKRTTSGWQWGFDAKLRAASPSYFTEEQVQSILQSITCPVLSIVARDGYLKKSCHYQQRAECIKHLRYIEIAGNHHLHMDEPQPVAEQIHRYMESMNHN